MTRQQGDRLEMLESVLGAMNVGAVVLDHAHRVVLWNRWMEQHSGLAADQVLGQDLFCLFPQLRGKRIDGAVQQALRNNLSSVLSQTLHKTPLPLYPCGAAGTSAAPLQQAVTVTPLAVGGMERHCLVQIADVSVAVNRERLLRDQALELRSQTFSDGLTGVANRRHFDVAVEQEVRRAKRTGTPLSLLMIDIDYFKDYNDHYGHQHGDDTLIRVASTLAGVLQRPRDLLARYGGEEFAAILPELDNARSIELAQAMRRKIAGLCIPHARGRAARHVTVSIGVASKTAAQQVEVTDLIGAADRALYVAKRAGRDRVEAGHP
jgi:diguanylate cyclase (GGDEF)-like protein